MNRLNIITLGVADMKKSLAFYKALGFKTSKKEDDPVDIVFFDNEGTKLALYPLDALALDISLSEPPRRTEGFSGITIAYNVKNLEEVAETLTLAERLGGRIIKPAEKVFWGGTSGYFEDLDGHIFEVAHSDNTRFDKQNMMVVDD